MKKRFGLIGVAGYIAPRHLQAIKDTDNDLIACMDIHDSVGILDSYFPNVEFFTEFERFSSFIENEAAEGRSLDYIAICSPNNLHLPHIQFALRRGINVICEKPLILNFNDLSSLSTLEKSSGVKVSTILQLRLHPSIIDLKEIVRSSRDDKIYEVELTYITSRGKWYNQSWKGDVARSGGVAMNIGVHLFDMLLFVFGKHKRSEVHYRDNKTIAGRSNYEKCNVNWFLSTDDQFLPENAVHGEKSTFRNLSSDEFQFEFSHGFNDLHTESYRNVLNSDGFGIEESLGSLAIIAEIARTKVSDDIGAGHHLLSMITK